MNKKTIYTLLCTTIMMTGQVLGTDTPDTPDTPVTKEVKNFAKLLPTAQQHVQELEKAGKYGHASPYTVNVLKRKDGIGWEKEKNQLIDKKRAELKQVEQEDKFQAQQELAKKQHEGILKELKKLNGKIETKDTQLIEVKKEIEEENKKNRLLQTDIEKISQRKIELEKQTQNAEEKVQQIKQSRDTNTNMLLSELEVVTQNLIVKQREATDLQGRVAALEREKKVTNDAYQQFLQDKAALEQQLKSKSSTTSASSSTAKSAEEFDSDEDVKADITGGTNQ